MGGDRHKLFEIALPKASSQQIKTRRHKSSDDKAVPPTALILPARSFPASVGTMPDLHHTRRGLHGTHLSPPFLLSETDHIIDTPLHDHQPLTRKGRPVTELAPLRFELPGTRKAHDKPPKKSATRFGGNRPRGLTG